MTSSAERSHLIHSRWPHFAREGRGVVMVDLLKRYLRPFRRQLALVIGLLFAQSIANLYLPELNADIINNGVVKGDLDYIWRTGAVMILVTLLFGGASVA